MAPLTRRKILLICSSSMQRDPTSSPPSSTDPGHAHVARPLLAAVPGLTTARALLRAKHAQPAAVPWSPPALRGLLVELSGALGAPLLTAALGLVRAAQADARPAAWLGPTESCFFPPDAAHAGVDLARLPVIRLASAPDLARAADVLLRAAAFDLIVLDLAGAWPPGPGPRLAPALVARLADLARTHDGPVLCLTHKPPQAPSLGPRVALRAQAHVHGDALTITPLKDPHHGTTWQHREAIRGALGMC